MNEDPQHNRALTYAGYIDPAASADGYANLWFVARAMATQERDIYLTAIGEFTERPHDSGQLRSMSHVFIRYTLEMDDLDTFRDDVALACLERNGRFARARSVLVDGGCISLNRFGLERGPTSPISGYRLDLFDRDGTRVNNIGNLTTLPFLMGRLVNRGTDGRWRASPLLT